MIKELDNIVEFIKSFSNLNYEKDFFVIKDNLVLAQCIMESVSLTSESIVSCCKRGCVADANMLIRKFRDDIFFLLYIICCNRLIISNSNSRLLNQMEENILRWNNNDMSRLQIGEILKTISNMSEVKIIVREYNLKERFDFIGRRLNNFTHGNGKKFYNYRLWEGNKEIYTKHLQDICSDLKYITIVFLVLLILCAPNYVASSDYVDYLDFGLNPCDGSQYWVAPFVEKFIRDNIDLIDENFYAWLKENTCMEI